MSASLSEECYDANSKRSLRRVTMSKLVKGWRNEDIHAQARHYVRTYILLPSGFLGLMCVLGGIGTLGYQLIAWDLYNDDVHDELRASVARRTLRVVADTLPSISLRRFPMCSPLGCAAQSSDRTERPKRLHHSSHRPSGPQSYPGGLCIGMRAAVVRVRLGHHAGGDGRSAGDPHALGRILLEQTVFLAGNRQLEGSPLMPGRVSTVCLSALPCS